MTENEIAVMVTTTHRGVFFGYMEGRLYQELKRGKPWDKRLAIRKCRNCLEWSTDVKGFIGLAVEGPSGRCKIGPASDETILEDITSVSLVTARAAERWEEAPWNS